MSMEAVFLVKEALDTRMIFPDTMIIVGKVISGTLRKGMVGLLSDGSLALVHKIEIKDKNEIDEADSSIEVVGVHLNWVKKVSLLKKEMTINFREKNAMDEVKVKGDSIDRSPVRPHSFFAKLFGRGNS